jgi:hypothetical protein
MESRDPEFRCLIPEVGLGHQDREREMEGRQRTRKRRRTEMLIDLINPEPDVRRTDTDTHRNQ